MEENKFEEINDVVLKLISRAQKSHEFKNQLIMNPLKHIENGLNKKLTMSEGIKFSVEDQTDISKVFVNIPSRQTIDNIDLTDEQLENVAGGDIALGIALFGIGLTIYKICKELK